jgi:aryl-alcohol dehydrogenase-like predicted oxidoreductase
MSTGNSRSSSGQSISVSIGSTLRHVLTELAAHPRVHLATKVRLTVESFDDVRSHVLKSFEASLTRLQCSRVTLLQIHNSITTRRGDQPTSITPDDVLGPRGILSAFEELQSANRVTHLGLTGLGDAPSLNRVVESGRFDTVQAPYNVLNPSAGQQMSADFTEANYGNLFAACRLQQMGVFAIRVFAGGALTAREPSAHTKITKFFPLDLYERDRDRARQLAATLPPGRTLPEEAVRFVLDHQAVTSALIGFGTAAEVEFAVHAADQLG